MKFDHPYLTEKIACNLKDICWIHALDTTFIFKVRVGVTGAIILTIDN